MDAKKEATCRPDSEFVNDDEMEEIRTNAALLERLKRGSEDASDRRGRLVTVRERSEDLLENDERFLARIEHSRRQARNGQGFALEDLQD